nr:MAG TPA: hypothetical protein [Caudoviricetes sp.]
MLCHQWIWTFIWTFSERRKSPYADHENYTENSCRIA